ncbi:MAG: hypothetical protein HZB13_00905 [Acidobacteria bacterium]|nr:hypothetical protein [Acidobacteriota bacterium]
MTETRRRWAGLLAVGALALLPRLTEMGRGFWMDEAFVANSIQETGWGEMFNYRAWPQVTPPLALVLWRMVAGAFGLWEVVLRLPSLAAGVGACIAMVWAARHWLKEEYALLSGGVLALSPLAVAYSKEVKHYSFELLLFALLAGGVAWYAARPGGWRAALLGLATSVGMGLGFAAMFSAPVVAAAVWLYPPEGRRRRGAAWGAAVLAATAAAALWSKWGYLAGKGERLVRAYWAKGYPEGTGVLDAVRFLPGAAAKVVSRLFAISDGERAVAAAVLGAALLFGVADGWRAWRRGDAKRLLLWLVCMLPLAAVGVAGVMQAFPFAAGRLTLFLAVPMVLAVAAAMEGVTGGRRAAVVAGGVFCVYGGFVALRGDEYRQPPFRDAMREVMAELRESTREGDGVYFSRSVYEVALFYARRDGAPRGTVMFREKLVVPGPFDERPDIGRWWLAFFGDTIYWHNKIFNETIRRREEALARGCRVEEENRRWKSVVVQRADCGRQVLMRDMR